MRKRLLLPLAAALLATVLGAGVLRAYVVVGPSDAPTLLWGDLVLVDAAAYDLPLPYTERRLARWREPRRGDMVLFRVPDRPGTVGLKRVVGLPGERIELRRNRLVVDGRPARYADDPSFDPAALPPRNEPGRRAVVERLDGAGYRVMFTPGAGPDGDGARVASDFAPVRVPPGHYFLLGDNRDHSNDSRAFGPVARERILGRLAVVLKRASE